MRALLTPRFIARRMRGSVAAPKVAGFTFGQRVWTFEGGAARLVWA